MVFQGVVVKLFVGLVFCLLCCSEVLMDSNANTHLLLSETMVTKTGTTIVGIRCRDGVVLGADTRSTSGSHVMCKNVHKIHQLSSHIYACGAGTSADCEQVTRRARQALAQAAITFDLCGEFHRRHTVATAVEAIISSLWQKTRQISAVYIVGGYDSHGPSLYQIDSDTVPVKAPFAALGSGSLDAIASLEISCKGHIVRSVDLNDEYLNISCKEGIDFVRKAVRSGILNDLGSGSHVDICVIMNEKVDEWREQLISSWDDDRPNSIVSPFPSAEPSSLGSLLLETNGTAARAEPLGRKVWSKWQPMRQLCKGKIVERTEQIDSSQMFVDIQKL